MAGDPRPHLAFVMEQHLGHYTYSANMRALLCDRHDVLVSWVEVDYGPTSQWWERIPSTTVRSMLRGRHQTDHGLAALRPDACVFNTQVPAVIGGRIARAQPFVLCTDITPVQYDEVADDYGHQPDRLGPTKWVKHAWNRRVFQRAAAHAPWSNWVRRSLVDDYGVNSDRIEVLPPGVDTARWPVSDHTDGPMRILFVGGDFTRKGGDTLLRAFATLRDAELLVVTRDDIEKHPRLHVYQNLAPNDPALMELYRTSHVFALPSRSEAFGIAAVEAAAAGLPIVATAVGGLTDLVVDGTTGFTIEPDDVDGLARVLRRLEDDPALRRRLGGSARNRAVDEFDAPTNADRLVALILAAAGHGGH